MATSKTHEVTVGDQTYTIQHFRGLKAIMAMASITRIAREVPDIMADAVKEYQRRNTVIITESMARLPRWSSFSVEDFDAAEKTTGRREIELPTPMTGNEQVMYALPTLLEKARKEITRLLALLVVPNAELREADKEDKVEEALDKYEETLLYDAEINQLVELCLAAQEVLQEQLGDNKDRMGNLLKSAWGIFQTNQQENQPAQPPTSLPPSTPQTSTQETSPEDAPTSSTDSDEHTDGIETQPSTESLGVSS